MASGAFNLSSPDGSYWRAYLRNTLDTWVRHSDLAGGTLSDVQVTTSADCATPRLSRLQARRMLLTYTRPRDMTEPEVEAAADPAYVTIANISTDFPTGISGVPAIYERISDDEGATWSAETLLTKYGLSPFPLIDPRGTLLRTFVRSQNFPYGPYGAQPAQYSPYAFRQYPGASTPGTVFHCGPLTGSPGQPPFARTTFPQAFGIASAMGLLWMHWPLTSGGQTALFHSADDGATWMQGRLPRAAMDGSNVKLGLAASRAGTLLLWTIQDQSMSASQIITGSIDPGQIFSDPGAGNASFGTAGANILKDDTGADFIPGFEQDVSFTAAYEGSRRWVMATELASGSTVEEWFSADSGQSVTLL
jgi:hypothetical protein